MTGIVTPGPDSGHTMDAEIPENPTLFLTGVDREAHDWMTRFAAGRASPIDLAAFKQWSARDPAHVEAFARACRLWEAIGPASEILAGAYGQERGARIGRRALIGGALAASAASAAYLAVRPPLGLWPSLSELAADYRTAPGEQRNIILAGGPSVDLNTRTSIALRTPSDGGTERIELIGGEAVIAARSGVRRAIEVIAGDGRVTANDAAFNIRYEHNIVCTSCIGGTVDVAQGNRSARLRPGEQIVYSSNGLGLVTTVDLAVVTAWKDGMLVFHSIPLNDAVAEINRYRSGRIIVTNAALGRRLFNARFQIANVDGVIVQIQQVFGASVTALPGGIVLLG
jgi:transmembrane sensor